MTSRERVKACLEFSSPDRPPRDLWASPAIVLFEKEKYEALKQAYPVDIDLPGLAPSSGDDALNKVRTVGTYTDEWGCVWHVGEPGVAGEVKEPPLADWSALADFKPPWELIKNRDFSYTNRICDQSDKFMLSNVTARPFERMQFLRGSETLYMDIAYDSAEFRKLLKMVHEYNLEDVKSWCKSNVDGVFLMDDWGSNNALLISPASWRKIFKPLYKEYCDIIHAAGKFVFFHSDGHIESIYEDLIEIGINAVNSQLFCMDVEQLAKKYKGRITFWDEIDRQHILPFGTIEEVRAAVMRVRQALDDGKGGIIAQCEWGKGNRCDNIEAVYKAWGEPIL